MDYQFTDQEIEDLIQCKKIIKDPPKQQLLLQKGSYRNGASLLSKDKKHEFYMFMRKNEDFEENFSIGLVYKHPEDGSEFQLIRCNGPHGPNDKDPLHRTPHIHKAAAQKLNLGNREPLEARPAKAYYSYEEALVFFVKKCNIKGMGNYIKMQIQRDLPFKKE